MTAPIGKSQFTFELPNLSYVDASLEEPNLRSAAPAPRHQGIVEWLARRVSALVERHRQHVALDELQLMSDHELSDIGLSRSDLARVFDPEHNADLISRTT
jgi:uncharacterized protein YjiS (DUF1127 family)